MTERTNLESFDNLANYRDLFGLKSNFTIQDLKKSYRALCMQFHPDLNPNNPESEEKIKKINAAYKILSEFLQNRKSDVSQA